MTETVAGSHVEVIEGREQSQGRFQPIAVDRVFQRAAEGSGWGIFLRRQPAGVRLEPGRV